VGAAVSMAFLEAGQLAARPGAWLLPGAGRAAAASAGEECRV
jgi:hypothetical protein